MTSGKIVLITVPYDQADVLEDFLDWHLDHGIDLILAFDGGSIDGTVEILDHYAAGGRVVWFPLPDRDMSRFSIADELAAMARDRFDARWIVYCDVDEFLSSNGNDLPAVLAGCEADGVTLIDIPRRTMTGPPLAPGLRATEALTLRVDRTLVPTAAQQSTWDFPVPFVFLEVGPHVAIRASAFDAFGSGAHAATITWGKSAITDLYILHYAIRGYGELQQKVRNTERWLADNPHLNPGWGWHWRRWIQLEKEGRLREDYDAQFVGADRARELIAGGVCAIDTTVSAWLEERKKSAASVLSRGAVS